MWWTTNFESGVVEVACGWAHSLALLEDGTLWGWGYNKSRQVTSDDSDTILTPTQIKVHYNKILIDANKNHGPVLVHN
jgi:alpha-tubulin suppressor-like RCC1 family protein